MRRSTRHLQKFLGTFEFTLLENDSLGIRVDRSNRVLDLSKSHSYSHPGRFVHQCHIRTMVTEYKSQGKVLAAVSIRLNRKIAKYESEKKKLESEGYKVTLTTFVNRFPRDMVQQKNTHCLKELGVQVVENSKNIFWRHILADKFRIIASRASKGSAPTTKETQISPRTSSSAIKLPEDRKRPRTTSPLPRPSPKCQKIRGKRAPRSPASPRSPPRRSPLSPRLREPKA
ncbi:hypothetical protein L596_030263 [Steinernema carpocapsae]|uniref:Uncharacterized protein n=1 Tax=Steinernema carpocapsae TaxID=34508 RepID=A0A4U5LNW4_STECR|nr:hypothetical protein L596_030263 [Steinernema carpocapsae]